MSVVTATPPRHLRTSGARWARPIPRLPDAAQHRRLNAIWGLLFINVLEYAHLATVIPIPGFVGKIITQISLWVALGLAVTLNRRAVFRSNVYLTLLSILAIVALALSIREYFGLGSIIRAIRLLGFVSTLWLVSPWWGRSDLLLLRAHLRWLSVMLASVVLGLFLKPPGAFYGGRLEGSIWPIPPPQVAHYAAITVGLTAVLWFSGLVTPKRAAIVCSVGFGLLLLTRTRTALFSMLAGILVASLSLVIVKQRVRRTLLIAAIVAGIIALTLLPVIMVFLARGQNAQELSGFTGRADVWHALINMPRSHLREVFGFGLSNKSFNGLPVDSSWLATYQDEGLFGDFIDGTILICLFVFACSSPRGAPRAAALFLVTYCLVASFTEVGLGDASPYLLDLTIAASLVTPRQAAVTLSGGT